MTDPTLPTVEKPPIDRPSLVERCMGDAGFACIILGRCQSQLGEMAQRVEAAATAGDAKGAGLAAHAIKGAAANLSAEGVRLVAERIEAAGKADDLTVVTANLPALAAEVGRCLDYLPTLIADLQRAAA